VTECQGCGAWNNTSRTLCVLCGTPLAETDEWDAAAELPPLPPLPDGGLHSSMPTWLREPPERSVAESLPLTRVVASPRIENPAPLGPRADPRTFLTDDDFPRWLRDLAARRDEAAPRSAEPADTPPAAVVAIPRVTPSAWQDWPGSTAPAMAPVNTDATPIIAPPVAADRLVDPTSTPELPSPPEPEPGSDGRLPAAIVAARALQEGRDRATWETLLLVFLFIGIIVAALWALVSNGVFSPGL
jgi:hypothetical protein